MRRYRGLAAPLCAALTMASAAAGVAAKQASHTHLAVTLDIKPSQPGVDGDMVGVYSFEIIPCENPQSSVGVSGLLQSLATTAGSLLISSAHANHRDHFDRIGAAQVLARVPLASAGRFSLGQVDLTPQSYCHVRLTFARLPVVTGPKPLPALDTSIFMARPAGLKPLALPYAVPFEIPLAQPWRPSRRGDALQISIDPSAAQVVLRDPRSEEGTLGRRVVTLWLKTVQLKFSAQP